MPGALKTPRQKADDEARFASMKQLLQASTAADNALPQRSARRDVRRGHGIVGDANSRCFLSTDPGNSGSISLVGIVSTVINRVPCGCRPGPYQRVIHAQRISTVGVSSARAEAAKGLVMQGVDAAFLEIEVLPIRAFNQTDRFRRSRRILVTLAGACGPCKK
jgi:hypothetical protein